MSNIHESVKGCPLKPNMHKDDIIAVKREDIIDYALKLAKAIDKTYKDTPYKVDMEKMTKIFSFITLLKHTGGSLGGVPFRLLPFQAEFLIQTLGVVDRTTGFRKHREVMLHVPRKQGKTELVAAIVLIMLFLDKEKQKELYSVATEVTQASIMHAAVMGILRQSPVLMDKVKEYKAEKKIHIENDGFIDLYRVLSAKAGTKDGLKGSTLLFDEMHAYPDAELYNVLMESTAHRDEGLSIIISTAGYNKQGIYHTKLLYARQVMDGTITDPYTYLMDFGVGDDEDWTKEKNWIRVNPALGFGVKLDYLRDKYHKALHSATEEVSFRTKHLNQFVDSAVTWIRAKEWSKSNNWVFDLEALKGRECYGGLDLSTTTDLTSFTLVFPNDFGGYELYQRNYIPEETATRRSKEDRVSYLQWAKEGHITMTPGNVIDYEYIKQDIIDISSMFDIKEIAFDRWNSLGIVTSLEEAGLTMVGFGQGYASMSSPTKSIEALVLQKKLNHGNNPVLNWAVSNVLIISDPAGNVKMDKSKSIERIDPAVSLAMAVGRADVYKDEMPDWETLIT